ncbi:MAG TPA: cytochrome c/FTR1 family iron permease [Gemmatimonadales bacterium]|jgi:high-affinity iron transporter
MILNGWTSPLLLAAIAATPSQQGTQDQAPVVRRLAATTQLAAQEYRVGIANGRVIAPAEVQEARLFLQEARRSAALLPRTLGAPATAQIDSLVRLLEHTASPDTVDARVLALTSALSRSSGVALDELPAQTPSLARGAQIYQANCAGCHGTLGRGDGPQARGLDPKPANLADWVALRDQSPLDYFRRVSIGVVGTAMPAFEGRLSPEDRWAVALYASVLRLPPPAGEVPPGLQAFATSGKMSDLELLRALGARETGEAEALARVARVRTVQADAAITVTAQTFDRVRAQIESTYALARTGDSSASSRAFDAYMTFEQVERQVRAKNASLASDLEASFASLRTRAAGGATAAELEAIHKQLVGQLENAERLLSDELSPVNLFVESFVILLREGLEAILIVGALMTFLAKMGAANRRRDVHIGVGAAVGASLLTAIVLETIFELTPAKREALEGATMILATVVLFYVSYWLLSKMEVAKWNHFVKSKVQDALTSGSALALASAAFLAVYREGFETVLFYKALFLSGSSGGAMPVVAGIVLGSVVLVAVYIGINRFGVRLPLKPFFGVTSAFLYYMAFVFAGKGIAELQEGGLISTTVVTWAPRVPALGVYPTVESLAAQGVLLLLLLAALLWTFVIQPRRMRVTSVLVPEPGPRPNVPLSALPPSSRGLELIRSLERMEADLAEIRAEVERMKQYLSSASSPPR